MTTQDPRILLAKVKAAEQRSRAKPRRDQAERSRATQTRILEAAVRLIRLRGFEGFSTEEIAQQAGVSRGAQRHHFPTRDALVVATLQHLTQDMVRRAESRIAASHGGGKILDHIIDDAVDFFFGDCFFITTSVMMSDERNDRLRVAARDMVRESRLLVEEAWRGRLEQAGLPRQVSADVLALTLSVIRGFGVRRAILNDSAWVDQMIGVWRTMVRSYLREHAPRPLADAIL